MTDTVTSGEVANFTCIVNSWRRILIWRIGKFGSKDIQTISGNYNDHEIQNVDVIDKESNRKTARLSVVASSNSVVQCVELQMIRGSTRNTYSQFAMLIVEPQHEGVSH